MHIGTIREQHAHETTNGGKVQDRVYMAEASTLLRRTPKTLRLWIKSNYGPRAHRDRQRIFYLREDIEAFLDSQLN